jgi:hypothetical protein
LKNPQFEHLLAGGGILAMLDDAGHEPSPLFLTLSS